MHSACATAMRETRMPAHDAHNGQGSRAKMVTIQLLFVCAPSGRNPASPPSPSPTPSPDPTSPYTGFVGGAERSGRGAAAAVSPSLCWRSFSFLCAGLREETVETPYKGASGGKMAALLPVRNNGLRPHRAMHLSAPPNVSENPPCGATTHHTSSNVPAPAIRQLAGRSRDLIFQAVRLL